MSKLVPVARGANDARVKIEPHTIVIFDFRPIGMPFWPNYNLPRTRRRRGIIRIPFLQRTA